MSWSKNKMLLLLAVFALVSAPLVAQGTPTGRISGQVSDAGGQPLPGVTVTFASPGLQGQRVTVSSEGGHYTSPPLPPGEYTVSFELQGYQPVAQRVRASAGSEATADIALNRVDVAEEIIVSGEAIETVSTGNTSSQTITYNTLEELPTNRTLLGAVALTPGVTGKAGVADDADFGFSISGAQTWDNLYTLNGVVLNENLRGQPFTLFIEDAIQETTVASGGVSAEYGRFTGGVVTAVTKSGGNDFSGSYRLNLTNQDWLGENEFSPDTREDDIQRVHEGTLGGRIVRDRLWFFGAGRDQETSATLTSSVLNESYPQDFMQERYEGKLTLSATPSHQLQASYIEIDTVQTNVGHGGLNSFVVVTDDGSLAPSRELPQELRTLSYTGVLTNNFFLEANYGEREFTFVGGGGSDTAFRATPVFDLGLGVIYNESIFCGVCPNEERDNEQGRVKGTWFASTDTAGAHDLVFGFETFTDIRKADNHQSPNDWMIWNYAPSIVSGGEVFPIFSPAVTLIGYFPILNPSQGTDFETQSVFANDTWRLNDRWSFNLGLRYDATDAVNANGAKVADDSGVSPRLGATWTPGGNSPWSFHAYAGRYVGQATNGIFDLSSPAGSPAYFLFGYSGPGINTGGGPLVDTETAVQRLFDNLFASCPAIDGVQGPAPPPSIGDLFACDQLLVPVIPGFSTVLDDGLAPNSADELKLGFSRALGTAGLIRADVIWREWQDFFVTRTDLSTGQVTEPNTGAVADLSVIVNDDDVMSREYVGLDVAFNAAFLDRRLRVGGGATISELTGTALGETRGSGPITPNLLSYPEYRELSWNAPDGRLSLDETVNLKLYGSYDIFSTEHNRLSASLLQTFITGSPYGATTTIDTRPFVDNPGYVSPPTSVSYWFTDRDAFEFDDLTSTDLALSYAFGFGQWEVFVQPELINVFDEDAVIDVNQAVVTAASDPSLQPFNPFTTTPIEGVHWRKGSNFGQPENELDLQNVRQFRVSLGFRFNP